MRITLSLDDHLLDEARRLMGDVETSVLVREALRALIQRESARLLISLGGAQPTIETTARRRTARSANPRQGWADHARRIAEHGDDAPVWTEPGTKGGDKLK